LIRIITAITERKTRVKKRNDFNAVYIRKQNWGKSQSRIGAITKQNGAITKQNWSLHTYLYEIYVAYAVKGGLKDYDWSKFYGKKCEKFLNTMQKIWSENTLPLPRISKKQKRFHQL